MAAIGRAVNPPEYMYGAAEYTDTGALVIVVGTEPQVHCIADYA